MRVLVASAYYAPAWSYGGPARSVSTFWERVAKKGHEVVVHTTTANGTGPALPASDAAGVERNGVRVHYHPLDRDPLSQRYFGSRRLKEACGHDAGWADLVSVHGLMTLVGHYASEEAIRAGTPYFVFTHGALEPWALQHKWLKKMLYMKTVGARLFSRAKAICVCNEAERVFLQSRGWAEKAWVQRWGYAASRKSKRKARGGRAFPRKYVLFLSRLHPKKGLDLLVPAFAEATRSEPGWQLLVAGADEDGYQAELEALVARIGVTDKVQFLGHVEGDEKEALLRNAAVFALTSYSEGFPMAVAEALGHGIPCLVTQGCHMPEVGEYGAGIEVPAEQQSVCRALVRMMGSANDRVLWGRAARRLSQERLSWDAVVDDFIAKASATANASTGRNLNRGMR